MLGIAQLTLNLRQELEALLFPYGIPLTFYVTLEMICTATVEQLMQTQSVQIEEFV